MPVQNSEVRDIFNKLADLLAIEGANPFRIRAYRTAARTVSGLSRNLSDMVQEDEDLTELAGIGEDLAGKIREIVQTGTLSLLEDMEKQTPARLSELMNVENLGPKRVKALNRELGITTLKELKQAAKNGKIRELEGFGKKTEQGILESLELHQGEEKRIKLLEAEQQAPPLVAYLKKSRGIKEITVAGSYRRRKETVGDLDILATCSKDSNVMKRFVEYEDVRTVISKGKSRSTIVLRSGLHVDLCLLAQVSYGAALHYFTGCKSHNIAVRKIGLDKGYKINEYGVFKGKKRIAGKTEEEVYQSVNLPYIEPELREDRGEIEAARKNDLPELIEPGDIQGDLHCHTKDSDGHHSMEDMARAAKKQGHKYLAITEHSRKVSMANGLDARRLAKQIEQIKKLNEKLKDFNLLKGIEVDILEDGTLDLPDDILKELDVVVCSVHYNRKLTKEKQTKRILRAMDNPYFNILAHPTGRLINERGPYELDLETIMKGAAERGCFLELNSCPDRLDLPDHYCRMARDMHVKLAISTDSHSTAELDFFRFGVDQARRGWLRAEDVINTYPLEKLKKMLKR